MSFPLRQLIILRHGEKPSGPAGPHGAAPKEGVHLSARGQARAGALAAALPAHFGRPDAVVAAKPGPASRRPLETVAPLARALGLSVQDRHADKNYLKAADELLRKSQYRDATVVLCWHHGYIPALVAALGATPPCDPWPEEVFDRYWVVTPGPHGEPQVLDVPQQLLYGDSAN